MGAPNDQTLETREEMLWRVSQQIASRPDHKATEDEARQTGLDIPPLFATYHQDVRPWRDHLTYTHILELDPIGERSFFQEKGWAEVLGSHAGLGKHGQAAFVLRKDFYCYDRGHTGPQYVQIAAFLTRDSKWLLWSAEGHDSHVRNERILEFSTIEDFWMELHALIPDRYKPRNYEVRGSRRYLPTLLHEGLMKLLNQMIASREERLAKMKLDRERGEQRMNFVRLEP